MVMNHIWKTNTSAFKTQFVEGDERKLLFEAIHHASTVKERESIDRLIVDAGNTANECGLLPSELLASLEVEGTELLGAIVKEKALTESVEAKLKAHIESFKKGFAA
jgi:F0F1-type ATP synthase alpha subunit